MPACHAVPFEYNDEVGVVTGGGSWHYQSRAYQFDQPIHPQPQAWQGGYGLLDLDATWQQVYQRPVDLSFFMTNVLDRVYRNSSNNSFELSGFGLQSFTYGPPRMFGFTVKYRFGASAR